MRSQTEGRASLITAWFLVRGQVCAKTRVTTLHTRSMERARNLTYPPPRGSLDPATSITIRCAKRTIRSSVAHVQPLEKGTRLELARFPRQPPHSGPSHKICEILCKMYNTLTHTRRGLFRSVQLSATTFVFARRGGAFTVCAHAAVVPASSFP